MITKSTFNKGDECLVVTTNSYGNVITTQTMEVALIGIKYITVRKNTKVLHFPYDNKIYNALYCDNEFSSNILLFENKKAYHEFALRNKYLDELKKLFNSPQEVTLSTNELMQLYKILKKENNNGTK